jgi:hypothetical protein
MNTAATATTTANGTQAQTPQAQTPQAQAASTAVNVGALFPSKNGSTKCPYIGIAGEGLLSLLTEAPPEQQWKLFTRPTEDGGLEVYTNLSSTVVGGTTPYNDNVPVCTLERTRDEHTPYRGAFCREALEVLDLGHVTVLATWRTAKSGREHLTLFYVANDGGGTRHGYRDVAPF